MNRHNGFVTCERCKCVTRRKKTIPLPSPAFVPTIFTTPHSYCPGSRDKHRCLNAAKCDRQAAIKTERDRRLHAALQAQHDRDVERQMGYEMKAYFTGMS